MTSLRTAQGGRRCSDRPSYRVPTVALRQADSALVAAAAAGDRGAWEALVDAHLPVVWRVARGAGLTQREAREVVALVWLRLADVLQDVLQEPLVDVLCRSTREQAAQVRALVGPTVPQARKG